MRDGKIVAEDRLRLLESVFEERKGLLWRYIQHLVRKLGIRGGRAAEDLLADVALIACQKMARPEAEVLQDTERLTAWLMRTALYVCLNAARKARRERETLDEYSVIQAQYEVETAIESDDDALIEQVDATIKKSFTKEEQEILRLAVEDGLPSTEIGERLGHSGDAIRQRKSRLLRKLRELLMH